MAQQSRVGSSVSLCIDGWELLCHFSPFCADKPVLQWEPALDGLRHRAAALPTPLLRASSAIRAGCRGGSGRKALTGASSQQHCWEH